MPAFTAAKSFYREMLGVARANLLPALVLQAIAIFLLWAYHYWPAAHDALNQLAKIKLASGFLFAFVASAIAGAVLPLIMQSLQRGDHRRIAASALPALFLYDRRGQKAASFIGETEMKDLEAAIEKLL